MLRNFLFAIAILTTSIACHSADKPESPATAVLHKVKRIMDAGTLDYAEAKNFLGVPLSTFKFAAIANGTRITSRSGEYGIKRGGASPSEFIYISFDMAWEAESNRASVQNWHKEKGLRSSLRVSFDQAKVCITKGLLEDELGREAKEE